ncbi:MAG: hypothetical protein E7211_20325 [Clostridium lundense]|nr:hypothetical protein [Clostridium lundense]
MDPILQEVYSIILPSAPFVIAAYVGIWVVLLVFVVMMLLRTKKTQKDIDALNEAIEYREGKLGKKADEE